MSTPSITSPSGELAITRRCPSFSRTKLKSTVTGSHGVTVPCTVASFDTSSIEIVGGVGGGCLYFVGFTLTCTTRSTTKPLGTCWAGVGDGSGFRSRIKEPSSCRAAALYVEICGSFPDKKNHVAKKPMAKPIAINERLRVSWFIAAHLQVVFLVSRRSCRRHKSQLRSWPTA